MEQLTDEQIYKRLAERMSRYDRLIELNAPKEMVNEAERLFRKAMSEIRTLNPGLVTKYIKKVSPKYQFLLIDD